jgi:hypothetical protein
MGVMTSRSPVVSLEAMSTTRTHGIAYMERPNNKLTLIDMHLECPLDFKDLLVYQSAINCLEVSAIAM